MFDLREENIGEYLKEPEWEQPKSRLLPVALISLAVASGGGFFAYRHFTHKKAKKTATKEKVVELAEFAVEKKPEKVKSENVITENATTTITLTLSEKELSYLSESCLSKKVEEKRVPIFATRIITKAFKRIRDARYFAKKLKTKIPDLDPWVLRDNGIFYVVAGSYTDPKNINEAVEAIKKLGIKPRLQKVKIGERKFYKVECEIKVSEKEKLLNKIRLKQH